MADVSKINLNGTEYDISDTTARTTAQSAANAAASAASTPAISYSNNTLVITTAGG